MQANNVYDALKQKYNIHNNMLRYVVYMRVIDKWNLRNEFYEDINPENRYDLIKDIDDNYEKKLMDILMANMVIRMNEMRF